MNVKYQAEIEIQTKTLDKCNI